MLNKVRLLEIADLACHKSCDWYINAAWHTGDGDRSHHLPGWGRLQLWQHHLCTAYERAYEAAEKKS